MLELLGRVKTESLIKMLEGSRVIFYFKIKVSVKRMTSE